MTTKTKKWPSLKLYDKIGVPYVVTSDTWNGPLWTGHCMMLSTADGYGDAGFFHELCHWLVASPNQRRYPDFAIGRQVNSAIDTFATSTSPHVFDVPERYMNAHEERRKAVLKHGKGWGEKCGSKQRAVQQEGWACDALLVYEPLVGLTTWNKPVYDGVNDAAHDFAGAKGWRTDRRTWEAVYKRIVKPLDGSVTLEKVLKFVKGLTPEEN